IHLHVELNATKVWVRGDAARLSQICWNLVLNALKFTPEGGRITLRTENPEPTHLQIEIEDTGIGIEPEYLPHIFEAFSQGHDGKGSARAFGGLGLGLTLVKELVKAHGGTIRATSEGR